MSRRPRETRRRRGQDGQATLEMIGIIPMTVLIAGAIIQLYLVGYAAVAAESAARLAAREVSQGTSTASAESQAEQSVSDRFEPRVQVPGDVVTGDEPSVEPVASLDDAVVAEATLAVPFLGIGVDSLDIDVTRTVVMPRTAD
jgi:hypothetical protein